MATTLKTTPPCVAIDATVLIALCAREPDKIAAAEREMERYAQEGYDFYAPGVILAESLFVLCRKLQDSILSALDHANAIDDLRDYMTIINSPPNGDGSLVARAEQIRSGYGCSRSADGIYIALAEDLTARGTAELVTFDTGMPNQVAANAPAVTVRLLPTLSPVPPVTSPSPPPILPPSSPPTKP